MQAVLPSLKQQIASDSAFTRATAVFALKFTITEHAPMTELSACLTDFLLLLKDPEIIVRRAALTTLNSATHNKPILIRPLMSTDWLLPTLYGETVRVPSVHTNICECMSLDAYKYLCTHEFG
jgi:cullin-associated NEDD8-dissociated protein 1